MSVQDLRVWVAAERLPEILAIHPHGAVTPHVVPPAARMARAWTRDEAITELLRGRFGMLGISYGGWLTTMALIEPALPN